MPKVIICASCGVELAHVQRAIKALGQVVTVVEPHNCQTQTLVIKEVNLVKEAEKAIKTLKEDAAASAAVEGKRSVLEKLDNFPFMKKIKELNSEVETSPITGDKRDRKFLREEVTSTAPQSIVHGALQDRQDVTLTDDPREHIIPDEDDTSSVEMEG